MRLFLASLILGLFLGLPVLAMNGAQEEEQMIQKTIVVQPDNDNTGLIIVAAIGLIGTLGAAVITTRSRKG